MFNRGKVRGKAANIAEVDSEKGGPWSGTFRGVVNGRVGRAAFIQPPAGGSEAGLRVLIIKFTKGRRSSACCVMCR